MIDAKLVVQAVTVIREGHVAEYRHKAGRAEVTAILKDCRDKKTAADLAVAILSQAIISGYCETVKGPTGRNDQTSNWKRDLRACFQAAYPSKTEGFTLVTKGKGQDRTVTVKWSDLTKLSGNEKFIKKINGLLDDCNPTEQERASIVARISSLYAQEQERLAGQQAQAQAQSKAVALAAQNAITARAKDRLAALGIKETRDTLAMAVAMVGGQVAATA